MAHPRKNHTVLALLRQFNQRKPSPQPSHSRKKDGGFFAGMNWEYSTVGYRFSQSPEVLELTPSQSKPGDARRHRARMNAS